MFDVTFLSINTTGVESSSSIYSVSIIKNETLTNWFMNPGPGPVSDYSKAIIPDDIYDYEPKNQIIPLISKELIKSHYLVVWDISFIKKFFNLKYKRFIDLKSIVIFYLMDHDVYLENPTFENIYKLLVSDEVPELTSSNKVTMINEIYNIIKYGR